MSQMQVCFGSRADIRNEKGRQLRGHTTLSLRPSTHEPSPKAVAIDTNCHEVRRDAEFIASHRPTMSDEFAMDGMSRQGC